MKPDHQEETVARSLLDSMIKPADWPEGRTGERSALMLPAPPADIPPYLPDFELLNEARNGI